MYNGLAKILFIFQVKGTIILWLRWLLGRAVTIIVLTCTYANSFVATLWYMYINVWYVHTDHICITYLNHISGLWVKKCLVRLKLKWQVTNQAALATHTFVWDDQ